MNYQALDQRIPKGKTMKHIKTLAALVLIGSIPSLYAMEETAQPRKPMSLKNITNNCFMNAALQVTYTMHGVTSTLSEQKAPYEEGSLSLDYCNLLPQMMYGENTIDPTALCFKGWHKMGIEPLKQSDTNDFLSMLLRGLALNDIKQGAQIPIYEGTVDQQTDLARQFYIGTSSSIYHEESGTFKEPRKEPVPCLTLAVNEGDTTLHTCLASHFQPKIESVRTSQGYPVDGTRQCFLTNTQKYLIFSFDRRGYTFNQEEENAQPFYTRKENPISFPLYQMSIKSYFGDQNNAKGPYELIGIIMHSGNAVAGHYTAYVKSGNQWYYCNDSIIEPLNEEDVEKIATQGYGKNKNTLPTSLVYQLSTTRLSYPPAKKIAKKPEPKPIIPPEKPRRTPRRNYPQRNGTSSNSRAYKAALARQKKKTVNPRGRRGKTTYPNGQTKWK